MSKKMQPQGKRKDNREGMDVDLYGPSLCVNIYAKQTSTQQNNYDNNK